MRIVRAATLTSILCMSWFAGTPTAFAAVPQTTGGAEEKSHTAKGHDRSQLYFALDGADVNAFNFNFLVTVNERAGFTVPVDGGLSMGLTRTYNSSLYQDKWWQCVINGQGQTRKYLSIPRQNPMGLGWEFHLGKIVEPAAVFCAPPTNSNDNQSPGLWTYVAPDGAEHPLVEAEDEFVLGVRRVYYSRDGSLLRAVRLFSPEGWDLYFPDGRVAEMRHRVQGCRYREVSDCSVGASPYFTPSSATTCPSGVSGPYDASKLGFYTTTLRMREVSGAGVPQAAVFVSYHDAPRDYIPATITDTHDGISGADRDIRIELGAAGSAQDGLVTSITFPAPPGAGAGSTFQFAYETLVLQIDPTRAGDGTSSWAHAVPILTRVTSPLGYATTYAYRDTPAYVGSGADGSYDWGGQLAAIGYPSGKRVELEYGWHGRTLRTMRLLGTPHTGCGCAEKPDTHLQFLGLVRKTEYVDGDATNVAPDNRRVWTFGTRTETASIETSAQDACNAPWPCPVEVTHYDTVTWMDDPVGNRSEIRYDTHSVEIPYNPEVPSMGPSDFPRFATAIREATLERSTDGTRFELRKSVTRAWDSFGGNACHGYKWVDPATETTVWHDDDETPEQVTTFTDRDAYHRPRRTEVSGSAVGTTIVAATQYAIDRSSNLVSCGQDAALYDAWLPGLVASRTLRERPADGVEQMLSVEEFAFDPTTGRTTRAIARVDPLEPTCTSPPVPRTGDVVTDLAYDDAGNVASTTVELMDDPGAAFITDFTWSFGVLSRQKNRGLSHYDVLATIDPSTSLVLREESGGTAAGDPLAVVRSWSYDALRRPTQEQVGTMLPWITEYVDIADILGDSRPRLVRVRTRQGDSTTSANRVESITHYARGGRVEKLEQLLPDGTRSYRHFRYDPAGQVRFESEWTPQATYSSSLAGTTTDSTTDGDGDPATGPYDPFGRPRRITGSLGELTDLSYFGTSRIVTVHGTQGTSGPFDVATTYWTDALGRLRGVSCATAGGDCPDLADAIYTYDGASRLRAANLVEELTPAPTLTDRYAFANPAGQVRTFTYDALGRGTQATHPENGTVQTLAWNALGQRTEVRDALGAVRGHYHRTTYDAAGRPTSLDRVVDGGTTRNDRWLPGDPFWSRSNWPTTDATKCLQRPAWYFGSSQCQYAKTARLEASLTSGALAIQAGTTLSFRYFREVREDGGGQDVLRVLVAPYSGGSPNWNVQQEIFRLDSASISWSRWKNTPPIPLDDWAGQTVAIRIGFDSGTKNDTTTLLGIGIDGIALRRASETPLATFEYDDPYGYPDNKARGRLTRVTTYDDSHLGATNESLAVYERRLEYRQSEGRLSSERIAVDWDRRGSLREFEGAYTYGSMGELVEQSFPHPIGEVGRTYRYAYRHGAWTGLTSRVGSGLVQTLVPDSPSVPGITYHADGGVRTIRYGNRRTTTIEVNAAYLPQRISVSKTASEALSPFDSGLYDYDGARNIVAIGSDAFAYDAASRLVRATIGDTSRGAVTLQYVFDRYGNLLARTSDVVPKVLGLEFSGRTYSSDNRIGNPGFAFDPNGNLTTEPLHDPVGAVYAGGYRYGVSPENRLRTVRSLDAQGDASGTVLQESLYDPSGHRFARVLASDGGQGRISLRDGSGQVVADYLETHAVSGLKLEREYVRAAGGLVATNEVCGPRPALRVDDPIQTATTYRFVKTTYAPPSLGTDTYTIAIESETGATKLLQRPDSLADHFEIPAAELFPGVVNFVRIEHRAACGSTGYSNAASVFVQGPPGGCLDTAVGYRSGFQADATSNLTLRASTSGCAPGTGFVVYYERAGTVEPMRVSPEVGIPTAAWIIPNVPAGAGHGRYWFRALDGPGGTEGTVGAAIVDDERTTGASVGGVPGEPSTVARYVHRDHLGSTRAVTDEAGGIRGTWKYYPFGAEANATGETEPRMKFTGHERDTVAGLDYMLARYYSAGLSRFLSTDPNTGRPRNPQSWNRFAYVGNNPLAFIDPNGESRYAILVGDPGLGEHNVGRNFVRVAETRQASLEAAGHTADITRVSTVGDVNAAITSGDTIDGGVILISHAGVLVSPSGETPALFIGEGTGADTNLTAANAGALSNANLGPDATVELAACNSAGVAQDVADSLDRPTTGTEGSMSFSPDPDNPMSSEPGTMPPETGPLHLVPDDGSRRVTREPS